VCEREWKHTLCLLVYLYLDIVSKVEKMFSSRPKKSRRPPQEPAPELPPEKSSSSKAERASRLDGEDTSRVKKKSGLKEERHGLFVLHPGTKQDRVKAE
jgi:hypothetical protein